MRNYLEEREEQADALWDAEERLSGALSGLVREEKAQDGETAAEVGAPVEVLERGDGEEREPEIVASRRETRERVAPAGEIWENEPAALEAELRRVSQSGDAQTLGLAVQEERPEERTAQTWAGAARSAGEAQWEETVRDDGEARRETENRRNRLPPGEETELPLWAALVRMDEISAGLGTAGAQAAPETGRNGTPGADMATGASRTGSLSAGEGSMGQKNGWAELETAGAQLRESLLTQRSRAGEDAAWQAEQLDQIFRRDSRRYDGGFFLY